jgi:type II secretory pathway component PulL
LFVFLPFCVFAIQKGKKYKQLMAKTQKGKKYKQLMAKTQKGRNTNNSWQRYKKGICISSLFVSLP